VAAGTAEPCTRSARSEVAAGPNGHISSIADECQMASNAGYCLQKGMMKIRNTASPGVVKVDGARRPNPRQSTIMGRRDEYDILRPTDESSQPNALDPARPKPSELVATRESELAC